MIETRRLKNVVIFFILKDLPLEVLSAIYASLWSQKTDPSIGDLNLVLL